MRPRTFPGHNLVYRGSGDIADLPCQRLEPGVILSVWELEPAERLAIAEGADVELVVLGEPLAPVSLAIHTGMKEIEGAPRGAWRGESDRP